MKTLSTSITALTLFFAFSGAIYAEGTKIEKSTLINAATTTNSINAAIGKDSTANTGSISVRGGEVKDSTLINAATTTNSINAAIGEGTSATTGGIEIK